MKISIVTLFPEMFEGPFSHSIIKAARDKKLIEINFVNIRAFGIGKHKSVDDRPYGGGKGMVLRVDVLKNSIDYAKKSFENKNKRNKQRIVLLDPSGPTYNQTKAKELSNLDHLILICGHYEGFDSRVKKFVDEEISVGDFILTGGEIPAIVIVDSVTRLKEGVLHKEATGRESFASTDHGKTLEHYQYTRPEKFKNLSVPKILLSGNHREIEKWRKKMALRLTRKKRPDLLKT